MQAVDGSCRVRDNDDRKRMVCPLHSRSSTSSGSSPGSASSSTSSAGWSSALAWPSQTCPASPSSHSCRGSSCSRWCRAVLSELIERLPSLRRAASRAPAGRRARGVADGGQQLGDVVVVEHVVGVTAGASDADRPQPSQQPEVVRGRAGAELHGGRELLDGARPSDEARRAAQSARDAKAFSVSARS
jgi:hypothetical protein